MMEMTTRKNLAMKLLGFILLFALGCTSLPTQLIEPKVDLKKVDIAEPTASEATVIFNFLVENPNPVALNVDQVDYALNLNGKPFTKGVMEKGLKLEKQSSAMVPLPVRVKYSDLISSAADLFRTGGTPYQMTGSVKVGVLNIPFNKSGTINISGP